MDTINDYFDTDYKTFSEFSYEFLHGELRNEIKDCDMLYDLMFVIKKLVEEGGQGK